ncbi:uncharacterized protein LOC128557431 [Mercenaria mercenaria]|uniref:uncharacterized protein LOC128557431 n=1 Tax=Mercenaria mercenaria TaxID=6596 RepID=UPI00234FA536|nr:uncharacterized protein LOC128557431 [Mercenaria mercenaria]
MASQIKKVKTEELPSKPFTNSGVYDDEVTLVFGAIEEKKLFVPRSFLCIASPVFKAMLKHDFKEKKKKSIKMIGKKYDDFLDFLLCIHPGIQKPVEVSNVLCIVSFAEEYQVTPMVEKCKIVMNSILSKAEEKEEGSYGRSRILYQLGSVRNCFYVLKSADTLNYTDVVNLAVKTIARFGHCCYTDEEDINVERKFCLSNQNLQTTYGQGSKQTYGDVRKECVSMLKKLSLELRCRILSTRLTLVNVDSFK